MSKKGKEMTDIYKALEAFLEAEKSDTATKIDQEMFPKPEWAVSQLTRSTGLVEDVCEHGIGHPNRDWIVRRKFSRPKESYWGTHGCDGCCSK
ncbi:hypothetical protein CL634_02250 [bacterium]|nr:hypothetical protein [bacterium]|tara:strand:- start:78 stop:356 length:279 start_codon:yes stop_codon:yes gene_type:complete